MKKKSIMKSETSINEAPIHVDMRPQDIVLRCPSCRQIMLQLPVHARPIQDQKLACPCCGKKTSVAKLHTGDGETYQIYRRQIDPNARMHIYSYKKSPT